MVSPNGHSPKSRDHYQQVWETLMWPNSWTPYWQDFDETSLLSQKKAYLRHGLTVSPDPYLKFVHPGAAMGSKPGPNIFCKALNVFITMSCTYYVNISEFGLCFRPRGLMGLAISVHTLIWIPAENCNVTGLSGLEFKNTRLYIFIEKNIYICSQVGIFFQNCMNTNLNVNKTLLILINEHYQYCDLHLREI